MHLRKSVDSLDCLAQNIGTLDQMAHKMTQRKTAAREFTL
jgi:hypothetical protein